MKMKTRAEATAAGSALKARMKQGRWRVQVWENLGWHYCLLAGKSETGTIAVHPGSDGKYYALLGLGGTGLAMWEDVGSYQDPNRAVSAVIKQASRVIEEHRQIVKTATEAAGRG